MTDAPSSPADVQCPYQFTGNADEEWHELFKAAYQFCVWADANCVGYYAKGEPQITWEVLGLDKFGDGTVDGITVKLQHGWSVGNDLVHYWHSHVLVKLAQCQWPDGDLEYGNQEGTILHLWHD